MTADEEGPPSALPDASDDAALEELLAYLRDSRGADFTGYKRPSLSRLLNRRLRAAGAADYRGYQDLLEVEPGELSALLDTLLVNVTAFYRDEEPWRVLAEDLLPTAIGQLPPGEPIRVWSAACATGEEAYTLAMLLHELLGEDEYKRRVKVYATDIDDGALAVARAGRYSGRQLEGLSGERRERYFEADGDGLRFRADLRQSLIFGRHDLLQDAPISRVLVLTCRNALMYFTPESQRRVLERFSFALHEHGLLLLGKAEMLLTQSQVFTPVSAGDRIFRPRRAGGSSRLAALAVGGPTRDLTVQRATVAAFVAAPAAQLVLDATGVLRLLNERAEQQLGLSTEDIGRVFGELELSHRPIELRGAVTAAAASRQAVELSDVEWLPPSGKPCRWDIRVAPLHDLDEVIGVHIVFEDVTEKTELRSRLETLDAELSTTYEELQSSSEELETTNEELQSAVEELETTNEELQSTNEELETMNEELQSTNEELQTLNDELRERTLEVDQVNGFLQSILSGLDLAVVVVDAEYRVQLWNGAAERLTGLRAFEAEGLPLLELPTGLPPDRLRGLLGDVVLNGTAPAPLEVPVTDRFGARHLRRVTASPLRRPRSGVQGAVLTLADAPG